MLMQYSLSATAATGEISNLFAVVMGIGTVFVGLLSIILICKITGAVCGASSGNKKADNKVSAQINKTETINNRQEIIAAVCAAAAEELGTDVNALRVVSFKKV